MKFLDNLPLNAFIAPMTGTIADADNSLRPRCPDFARLIRESSPDRSLFAQIAECFSTRLEDFANYYCRDHTLGKDAFQEAMITAMTKLDTYRGDSPIEPWLRRIVATSCSRLRRGMKNNPSINVSFEAAGAEAMPDRDAPSAEWSLVMARSFESLRLEMEKLKEPDRSLLIAHDMHEESIVDLSARFHLSVDGVKSRLKRSRQMIREALMAQDLSPR